MSGLPDLDTLPRAVPEVQIGSRRVGEPAPRGAGARRGRRRARPRPARSTPARRDGPPILARPRAQASRKPPRRPRVRRKPRRRASRRWRVRLPRRWAAWAWFLLLLAATLALAGHPSLRVAEIQVVGLRWTDPDRVRALPAVAAWRGRPLSAVDAAQAADLIRAAWPALDAVQVQVAWPNRMVIHARERQPVLVWQVGRQTWWVDAQGVAFAALDEADPTWPVVEVQVQPGMEPPPPPRADEVALALALRERLEADAPLVYHPVYGFGWRAPQGWLVFIGRDAAGLDVRLAVYEALVPTLEARGLYPVWMDLSAWQTPTLHFESEAR